MSSNSDKTYFFESAVPCLRQRNFCRRLQDYLDANGYYRTEDHMNADIIMIDTCGFHQFAEDLSVEMIKKYFDSKSSSSKLVVVGCLTNINYDRLSKISDKIKLVTPSELDKLDVIFDAKFPISSIPIPTSVHSTSCFLRNFDEVVSVHISRGCAGSCTYCAGRFGMGKTVSRPLKEIVDVLKVCVDKKAKFIHLETQDLGGYGLDINTSIVELLQEVFILEGEHKFILHDFNARFFIKYYNDIKELLIKNNNKIAYLNVPVESGSNRILKLMNRQYCIEDVEEVLFDLKNKVPKLELWCNIMCGFPTETEEDFEKTKEFVTKFSSFESTYAWITPYADRPNTKASKIKGKINQKLIDERIKCLSKIVKLGSVFV